MGAGSIFLAVVLLCILVGLVLRISSTAAPQIQFERKPKGIGLNTSVIFEVRDAKHHVKAVHVQVEQGAKVYNVSLQETNLAAPKPAWWKLWAKSPESRWMFTTQVGRKQVRDLEQGRATLHIIATNDSWGRFFRGGRADVSLDLPVRFAPPSIEVLTTQHYINQGGCDMVVFKVSSGTVDSGVQIGSYFFPSWPIKESMPQTRLAIFAYPYDLDPSTPARIVARDDADNQSAMSFTYRVFPKKFHSDTINLTDDFMNRVVPTIMSQTQDLDDQGSLLKNFLFINGHLRQVEAQQLVEFSKKTAPRLLWTQPFIELPSKVEASFADYRTYTYGGQVVDHQTHLGFDLAGLQHMPIQAANDGVVVYAGFFGIYGTAVILDHGCGLQTLYGHMSSINVKPGEAVKRGQVIGRSGETGLAGGDHLHFTVLLDGIPVNPTEWWDPHWIHDRIQAKLVEYQQG
jgi:murein DD-endopeptidase MepM/ murein hydrolase activator NlpD